MKTKRRIISALLILLIFFVLFASYYFILHETRHDCSGEDCPVCALVAICRNTLRSFSIGLILFALLLASVARSFSLDDTRIDSARAITPVSLKDKLLN